MAKLGVGVVGVGRMGRRHAENLRSRVPEAKLVAVADVHLEAARAKTKALDPKTHQLFLSTAESGQFEVLVVGK